MASPSDPAICAATTQSETDGTAVPEGGAMELVNLFECIDLADGQSFMVFSRTLSRPLDLCVRVPPEQPFRFMGLPTELRLHIARYALASNVPREWRWQKYTVGSFPDTDNSRALCQVSRQLHRELTSIYWNVNDFGFMGPYRGSTFTVPELHGPEEVRDNSEAYMFFLKQANTDILGALRSVIFRTTLWGTPFQRVEALRYIGALPKLAPHVQIRVVDDYWSLIRFYSTQKAAISGFITEGHRRVSELETAGLVERSERQWRLFPLLTESDRLLFKHGASSADMVTVLDWADNGI